MLKELYWDYLHYHTISHTDATAETLSCFPLLTSNTRRARVAAVLSAVADREMIERDGYKSTPSEGRCEFIKE